MLRGISPTTTTRHNCRPKANLGWETSRGVAKRSTAWKREVVGMMHEALYTAQDVASNDSSNEWRGGVRPACELKERGCMAKQRRG